MNLVFHLLCQMFVCWHYLTKILTLYLICNVQSLVSGRDYTIMEPAYDPDWGEWNDGALCPDHTFAHG